MACCPSTVSRGQRGRGVHLALELTQSDRSPWAAWVALAAWAARVGACAACAAWIELAACAAWLAWAALGNKRAWQLQWGMSCGTCPWAVPTLCQGVQGWGQRQKLLASRACMPPPRVQHRTCHGCRMREQHAQCMSGSDHVNSEWERITHGNAWFNNDSISCLPPPFCPSASLSAQPPA